MFVYLLLFLWSFLLKHLKIHAHPIPVRMVEPVGATLKVLRAVVLQGTLVMTVEQMV